MRRLCPPPAPTHIRAFAPQGPVPLAQPVRPTSRGRPPRSSLPHGRWAEPFADDLNTRRGIVSGRVALLPRSTEIQPHVASVRPSPPQLDQIDSGSGARSGATREPSPLGKIEQNDPDGQQSSREI